MAQPYLEQLVQLVAGLDLSPVSGVTLACKHFFSGAALYANGKICASLSPGGLALKLPEEVRRRLLEEEQGAAFRFFAQGPVKREYVRLSEAVVGDRDALGALLVLSVNYVSGAVS